MCKRERLLYLIGSPFITVLVLAAVLIALSLMADREVAAQVVWPHSPAHTVIDADTTWGPGVVTATGDVVVNNGATLTVLPGTEVRMLTDTTPYAGGVSDLIEIIVEDGRLVADGTSGDAITFTSSSPSEHRWWGIRILSAGHGESVLNHVVVEYGVWGIYVEDASPSVTYCTIREMRGVNGINGVFGDDGADGTPGTATGPGGDGSPGSPGGDGGDGQPAYGVYISGTASAPFIAGNEIYRIGGGMGGWGGNGGDGGDGGTGYTPQPPALGVGGAGGAGGPGEKGGDGGQGGDAAGIYVRGGSPAIRANYIHDVTGNFGGGGGVGGHGGNGGEGGDATCDGGPSDGGAGGNGGNGSGGGVGGDNGRAWGIYVAGDGAPIVQGNRIADIRGYISHSAYGMALRWAFWMPSYGGPGGEGGRGGPGGKGGCAGDGGDGGGGGRGGDGGVGGAGGESSGIATHTRADVTNNVVYGIVGGSAGGGGWGGNGGGGGNGGLGTEGGDSGAGGWGGNGGCGGVGGDAGDGSGVYATAVDDSLRVVNNTVDRLKRGSPGSAGNAGDGGSGGSGTPLGQDGDPGLAGTVGAEGKTVGLHFAGGAAGSVYNNVVVRTAYTTTAAFVGSYENSFGIRVEGVGGLLNTTTAASFDHNDVWNWETNYSGVATGTHDVSTDPLFAGILCVGCEDFRLRAGSPCIDAASNAQAPADDHDGALRPQDGDLDGSYVADMGAYEFIAGATTFTIPQDTGGGVTTADGHLEIAWLPGAVTCTTAMTYTPLGAPGQPLSGTLAFGGIAFDLQATDCHGAPVVGFASPPTLTIHYVDALLPPEMNEQTMAVHRWDSATTRWVELLVVRRDIAANTITARLDHLSRFATAGEVKTNFTYLPLVLMELGLPSH